jgi:hypothetical protein
MRPSSSSDKIIPQHATQMRQNDFTSVVIIRRSPVLAGRA